MLLACTHVVNSIFLLLPSKIFNMSWKEFIDHYKIPLQRDVSMCQIQRVLELVDVIYQYPIGFRNCYVVSIMNGRDLNFNM